MRWVLGSMVIESETHRPRLLLTLAVGWALLAMLFGILLWLRDLRRHAIAFLIVYGLAFVVYLAVVVAIVRAPTPSRAELRRLIPATLLGAIVLRLMLAGLTPTLSDDIYRYQWDGRMQQAGINPYRYAPADSAVAGLRDAEWSQINHKDIVTIYPPLSQAMFRLGAWCSPTILTQKWLFMGCELVVLLLLPVWLAQRGVNPLRSLIYAWHPLAIVEVAGSGHNDALGVLCLLVGLILWAARRRAAGTVAFALCFLSKLVSALLVPFYLIRAPRQLILFSGVILLGFLPFLNGWHGIGAPHASSHWEFNSSIYGMLYLALRHPLAIRAITIAGLALAGWYFARRTGDPAEYLRGMIQVMILCTPVLEPWYLLWLIPLLCARLTWMWLLFSGAVALSYVILIGYVSRGVWHLPVWVQVIEYAPLYAWLLLEARKWISRAPWRLAHAKPSM